MSGSVKSKIITTKNLYRLMLALSPVIAIGMLVLGHFRSPGFYQGLLLLPITIALAFFYYYRLKHLNLLLSLEENWGKEILRKRNFPVISSLHQHHHTDDNKTDDNNCFRLDDQTCNDLHIEAVFSQLDRTFTTEGESVLYDLLRTPRLNDVELLKRHKVINRFQTDRQYREKIQVLLSRLGRDVHGEVLSLLWEEVPQGKSYRIIFTFLSLLALAALVSPFFIGLNSIFAISGMLGLNSYIHYRENKKYSYHIPSMSKLGRLLRTAKKLAKIDHGDQKKYGIELKAALEETISIQRTTQFLYPRSSSYDTDIIYEYLKTYFLAEVISFHKVIDEIRKHNASLKKIYYTVGEIDALQSVASYRDGLPDFTEPQFILGSRMLEMENGRHPLVDNAIPNSISIKDKGFLITGSNMSGKSTFLRTVGINAVFAQTIYTCLADSYHADFLKIVTSISISDDISAGKSFYFQEAERLLKLVQAAEDSVPAICIIDELLSGTNYVERLAASESILDYLSRQNCLVIAATHDLDLAYKLNQSYRCYHFTDRVTSEGLDFDYKLKEGISRTRNAIKLLEYLKYPMSIVNQASEAVKSFVEK